MISRRCAIGAAAAVLLAAAPGSAIAGVDATSALTRQILSSFGVEAEIEAIAEAAVAYVEAHRDRVAPQDRERLRAILEAGLRPETLYALSLDELLERYEPEHAAAARDWLGRAETRDLLDRGRDLERAAACLQEDTREALGRARSAERTALLRRVARETSASARALRGASRLFAAMLTAANEALPEMRRIASLEVEQLLASHRAHLASERARDARAFDCVYRDVALETLRAAVRFLDGEAGRWMRESVDAALERALRLAAEATAVRIVNAFGADARSAALLRSARALPRASELAGEARAERPVARSARPRHTGDGIPVQAP